MTLLSKSDLSVDRVKFKTDISEDPYARREHLNKHLV